MQIYIIEIGVKHHVAQCLFPDIAQQILKMSNVVDIKSPRQARAVYSIETTLSAV